MVIHEEKTPVFNATLFHRQNNRYYIKDSSANMYLTEREIECAHWLSHWLSNQEVAAKMTISVRTVEHYLKVIKYKLNCYSKIQLVRLLRSGLDDS